MFKSMELLGHFFKVRANKCELAWKLEVPTNMELPQTIPNQTETDICLILEGSYPYVFGGVSSWTQDLILACSEFKFSLISIHPADERAEWRYERPANLCQFVDASLVIGGETSWVLNAKAQAEFTDLLCDLVVLGRSGTVSELMQFLDRHAGQRDVASLISGPSVWGVITSMYERLTPDASFIQFFWGWRSFFTGVFNALRTPLPRAETYHAITTGFAGLMAARATIETGRPSLLTEHGIYTNERRIELMQADWVYDRHAVALEGSQSGLPGDIRDFWISGFESLAGICYDTVSEVISLSDAGRNEQIALGADPVRCRIIPNGIDATKFADISRHSGPPCVALIGRVVSIKDIVTFLKAVAILKRDIPDVSALVVGPQDEEPGYAAKCHKVCLQLGLKQSVNFTGLQPIKEVLGRIDLAVLTSTSESLPLVLLEAGAAGIACIATDVGACREVIDGRADEVPVLGSGGRITRLAAPEDTAAAMVELLQNPELRLACGAALRSRVSQYYQAGVLRSAYLDLYSSVQSPIVAQPDRKTIWQE